MADPRSETPLRTRAAKPAGEGAAFSPLYRQIKELLVQSLDRGEWKPGELIPSEIDLAARFQVSQGTVRKAVDELAAEHLLLRRQGKGTFVATHHEARVRYRFLRLAADEEGEGGRAESRILECRRVRAPAEIARALELRAGETVVMIRRQLSMNQTPTVIDDIWLPGTAFRGLTLELLTANRAPMYGLFESEFGVSMVRADEKLRAVAANEEIARLLNISPGAPLLQVDRISYTYGDRPMEVRRGLYLTDHYHYRNSLN
ncbi:GntR family transcriptional regulator [Bordetella genomosp. 1]|uniref:GntR family transcriptional regulator n=1 Tax=Bordetella genomosp. 1 TaxID=1395607 RepID=A0A261SPK3_9BORD|nr:GntR family transcriptional regulator [Bordetella genomosp. 1]OZI39328.1 GntR family transcriptional regulator [Bordetella genomosp. 1]OZI65543.1 GntR family transcriptional regulator [Bordetella genomosp. 1]